jgi:microcystin-dependent protein
MTGRNRWLTPNTAAAGFICRRLLIPNGVDWLDIVTGAINELIYSYNFEQQGTVSPDDTAAAFAQMFDRFCYDSQEECRLIGEIVTFAGSSNPSVNFLLCDGSSYLRSDYPDLFAVIGSVFGSADSTHFNVPDLRGRTAVGAGTGPGLSSRSLGASFGEESHTLTGTEMPSHTHTDTGHLHAEGTATPFPQLAPPAGVFVGAIPGAGFTGVGNAAISNTGGGGSHNNMQPSLVLNYFIVAL